jgi:hypothetical protein
MPNKKNFMQTLTSSLRVSNIRVPVKFEGSGESESLETEAKKAT